MRVIEDLMNMGGRSFFLDAAEELAQLPPEAAGQLTARQRAFFQGFPDTLHALADRAVADLPDLPALATWLHDLAAARCTLEVHLPEYVSPQTWLRFPLEEKWRPAFNLLTPSFSPEGTPPAPLDALYRLVGEIDHNGFMWAGGLQAPERRVMGRGEGVPLYLCYQTFNGDSLGYDAAGQAYWYLHEGDAVRRYGPVMAFLEAYLAALCAHTELWAEV